MPNEENTRQMGGGKGRQFAAFPELHKRLDSFAKTVIEWLDGDLLFRQQMVALLDEILAKLTAMLEKQKSFRAEAHEKFRKHNQDPDRLNSDSANLRAELHLLEKRVARLEEQRA